MCCVPDQGCRHKNVRRMDIETRVHQCTGIYGGAAFAGRGFGAHHSVFAAGNVAARAQEVASEQAINVLRRLACMCWGKLRRRAVCWHRMSDSYLYANGTGWRNGKKQKTEHE
jgi:hypothetical protein